MAKETHTGYVIVVRFADDSVLGFQSEMDAKRLRAELEERFRKFKLELHPDNTRAEASLLSGPPSPSRL
jgi:hypothetical protein